MYEYRCTVLKVVDGDTADVDIDLGFGIVLTDERVRLMGIDTPESRTSDKVEDLFGELAKARLKGHAVAYFGGSKEEIAAKHLVNRDKLLREGLVSQEDFDKATAIMEKKNS